MANQRLICNITGSIFNIWLRSIFSNVQPLTRCFQTLTLFKILTNVIVVFLLDRRIHPCRLSNFSFIKVVAVEYFFFARSSQHGLMFIYFFSIIPFSFYMIAIVVILFDIWYVAGLYFFPPERVPIKVFEPWMAFDFFRAIDAQSF